MTAGLGSRWRVPCVLQMHNSSSDKRTVTRTLLLADDSVTIQRVIELTFADEDIRVVTVGDGDQAIARLEEQPPDIVLADVAMPGKSGYEVASYIKRSDRLAHIPVLLLTGAFEPVDQRRAAEAGCDGVLAKPFEPQFVIGRVKELLGMPGEGSVAEAVGHGPTAAREAAPTMPAAEGGAPPSSLTEYLDQLDHALANLPAGKGAAQPEPSRVAQPPARHAEVESLPRENDWDISLDIGSDGGGVPAQPSIPAGVPSPRVASPRPAGQAGPALPALAEAFSALLAAEHDSTALATVWPAESAAVVSDDVIDKVVERVLARLSDRVVRETVTNLTSEVAERLVREEIERIKASIT